MTELRQDHRSVMMLGTFGLRPKATLRSRALAIASTLVEEWSFQLVTTPWDHPSDSGKRWVEDGIPVVNTHFTRPALFPLAVTEMIAETRRMRPSLVHLFKPKGFGDLAARWLAKSTPVVVDMDDWEGDGGWNEIGGYGRLQRRVFDWQERTWPRRARAVTVASRELERRAIELGAPRESVFYVPNGLTRRRFQELEAGPIDAESTRQRLNLSSKRVVLLYTRFVEFEPAIVVRVMSRVRTEVPEAILLIVGASAGGDAEREIQFQSSRSGQGDSIVFAGWAAAHDIPGLLAAGDVAIHPFDDNLVNRSKCSVKLLELMASGRPIVTSPVGENAQMIEHGSSGLLTAAGDADAMASQVVELLRNPDLATSIGATSRERVERHYLWDRLAVRVAKSYEHAWDSHPKVANFATRFR